MPDIWASKSQRLTASVKTEDSVPVGKYEKIWKKYGKKQFFCILKFTEERSRIRIF
jgi:hypothetical protein